MEQTNKVRLDFQIKPLQVAILQELVKSMTVRHVS